MNSSETVGTVVLEPAGYAVLMGDRARRSDSLCNMVSRTGAGYVVWSATWCEYLFPAPIKAIDSMVPGHTCERDLIGEIAHSLGERSIRLIIYYHLGCARPYNWINQDDKELFLKNFFAIMTEVGGRYGSKLDGWMIDDGMVLSPAPYEELGRAMKAGNPGRIISYNSWILPRMTEFQDFHFGECNEPGEHGMGEPGTGTVSTGGQEGLQSHACFVLDGPDWGIRRPDTVINAPRFDHDQLVEIAANTREKRITLSFNLLMYEDGTVSQESLDALKVVRETIEQGERNR